jgi:hypothetical protein
MTPRIPGSVPAGWQRDRVFTYKARKSGGRTGLEGAHGCEKVWDMQMVSH